MRIAQRVTGAIPLPRGQSHCKLMGPRPIPKALEPFPQVSRARVSGSYLQYSQDSGLPPGLELRTWFRRWCEDRANIVGGGVELERERGCLSHYRL